MTPKLRRVRSLILRNYLSSAVLSFAAFALMLVLFGFELEDAIFDHQLNLTVEQLEADIKSLPPSGRTSAVEMQYYVGRKDMPDWMKARVAPNWRAGNYEIFAEELGHFHLAVRESEGQKLYLLFNARPFIRSTPQIKSFLLLIAGMATLALLVSLFFMSRTTKRVTEPLENMAAILADGDAAEAADTMDDGALVELRALVRAIGERDNRIQTLLSRERQFNRDASHELRTPLAVAMGASEVLEKTGTTGAAFNRLKTALSDMQHLTEGILWLSRDPEQAANCAAAAVGAEAISAYKHLLQNRTVSVELIEEDNSVVMPVPTAVAQVMIGNIVRNAFSYTEEGSVTVVICTGEVRVSDTGVGYGNAEESKTGFGIGLSLVERLCQHFGLRLDIAAGAGKGTVAAISWDT